MEQGLPGMIKIHQLDIDKHSCIITAAETLKTLTQDNTNITILTKKIPPILKDNKAIRDHIQNNDKDALIQLLDQMIATHNKHRTTSTKDQEIAKQDLTNQISAYNKLISDSKDETEKAITSAIKPYSKMNKAIAFYYGIAKAANLPKEIATKLFNLFKNPPIPKNK